jgi:exodeoxyribonuclease V alpha subunit
MEEALFGVITKVTYYSDETHFGVVKIKLDYQDRKIAKYKAKLFTNLLTVTANFDRQPIVDEEYDFYGQFVTNQYGMQFKANRFSRRNENTEEGVITYLSSNLFPGVGKVAATKIYQEFGKDSLNLIEEDPSILDKVPGLSFKQKETIKINLQEHNTNKRLILSLLDLGITMRTSLKLIQIFGNQVYEIISENPYQLIDSVEGFGFKRADKIARDLGIEEDSEIRLQALFYFLLKELIYSTGNTYLRYEELAERIRKEVNNDETVLEKYQFILKKLIVDKKIIFDEEKNIYLYNHYFSENLLAEKVIEILNHQIQNGYNKNEIDASLEKNAQENNITYTQKQKEAIKEALLEPFIIITGGPGTGKSTIIKAIIDIYVDLSKNENIKEKTALLAPTGRAAKRLMEITKFEAQTIHKYLGYEGSGIFKNGPEAKIDSKMVIIDEFSMVDIQLAARLLASLEEGCRIVLVGDEDQLPSVEPGQVLSDLIACKEIKTIKLDQIHRQSTDSTIISLAHNVNQGLVTKNILEKQHDRNFIRMQDKDIIPNILKTVEQAIEGGMDLVRDIQILVPTYKGQLGINAINQRMQEQFNPNKEGIKHLGRVFKVNDKVIQLVNRSQKKVMNGDIGYVFSLNMENGEFNSLSVLFDFGLVDYQKDELEDLNHAYAISIHKSQGSEFDLVIMPFSFKYYIMLKRKLIYTAITRAKKYLIMVGSIEAFSHGILGIEKKRQSKLAEKIISGISFPETSNFEFEEMANLSPYDFLE